MRIITVDLRRRTRLDQLLRRQISRYLRVSGSGRLSRSRSCLRCRRNGRSRLRRRRSGGRSHLHRRSNGRSHQRRRLRGRNLAQRKRAGRISSGARSYLKNESLDRLLLLLKNTSLNF